MQNQISHKDLLDSDSNSRLRGPSFKGIKRNMQTPGPSDDYIFFYDYVQHW